MNKNSYFSIIIKGLGILLIIFFIILFKAFNNQNLSSKTENSEEYNGTESVEAHNNVLETNICSICGRKFEGNGYAEQDDGSWKKDDIHISTICSEKCGRVASGKINEVAEKYGIDLKEEDNNENLHYNDGYYIGNDGKVYEVNKCTLCKGTGIETGKNGFTGEISSRICPMCDGKGVRSY